MTRALFCVNLSMNVERSIIRIPLAPNVAAPSFREAHRQLDFLPAELSFLASCVAPATLRAAAAQARAQAVAPEAALLASGAVSEAFFYRSLARHLGVAFIDSDVELEAGVRYPHSIHSGVAPLAGENPRWLVAPRGKTLSDLMNQGRRGELFGASLAIATPTHLSWLVRAC
jgi:hypothetical protein